MNSLSVSKNSNNKPSLILDLRYVNKHVYKHSIKFDNCKVMQSCIEKDEFMFKFDISQGYHHIDVDKNHQKVIGFSCTIARYCKVLFVLL